MNTLNDLLSKDPQRIWSASSSLKDIRDMSYLKELSAKTDEIERATKGIDLGGKLNPNSYHLEFALKKLNHVKNDLGCLCALYPDNMFFNPEKENDNNQVKITDTVTTDDKWVDYYLCECTHCHSKFKVEEREGHFTWWSWKKA
ncbi:hypothetical protein [Shewanella ulleungensis]|uniref:hypothetical protein n=1 Tax=Shewanella ulleungensis TaxID=2282699 RepID=UPI003D7B657C